MKIQLDTEKKTVKVEGEVILNDFINNIKKLLPKGEWKKYSLLSSTTINNWVNPIVIDRYPTWQEPWIQPIYGESTNSISNYNIKI